MDNSTYICPSPQLPQSIENNRRKRQTGQTAGLINSLNKKFYIGIKLDGIDKYENVSETLGSTYGVIKVFSDPIIDEFSPFVQVFKTKSMTRIVIHVSILI